MRGDPAVSLSPLPVEPADAPTRRTATHQYTMVTSITGMRPATSFTSYTCAAVKRPTGAAARSSQVSVPVSLERARIEKTSRERASKVFRSALPTTLQKREMGECAGVVMR